MKTSFIADRLRIERHTDQNQWLFATEVQACTGFTDRRFDAFAINCYQSKNYERIAYEIKVNRRDWLNELKDPIKRLKVQLLCHRFFFVLAEGIFQKEDLCKGRSRPEQHDLMYCGILEVSEEYRRGGHIKRIQNAKPSDPWPLPESFFVSFARKCRDGAVEATQKEEKKEITKPQETIEKLG